MNMAKDSLIKTVVRGVVKEEVKTGFDEFEVRMKQMFDKMASLLKNDLMTIKDEIMGELKTVREEQTMLNGRSVKINDIEDEVEQLKNIHPKFTHASL